MAATAVRGGGRLGRGAAALAGNYRARAEEYARMSSPRPTYDDWTFLCVVAGDLSRALAATAIRSASGA
ncbi:hypothetical protein ACFV2X_28895 [Streptomyces sp. NPDC059679]|uniref:hypothetical protein n=1 Tax=Streptomyces sp. NPDC059679 TaxID=3346903 RepID=UPI00368D1278